MWRRAEACDQVDSSRVTSFQSPTKLSIVDSPNVYVPLDTPEPVDTHSPTPSVFAQTPKLDRYLNSTTPQGECPDTLQQLRALAAHKRVAWAKTLETKLESPAALPFEEDPAAKPRLSASSSFSELDDAYPRIEDSGQHKSFKAQEASLPQVSPFVQSIDSASQVGLGRRAFMPGPVATPHWYHNPYTSESPTKLTSTHSAQSLVYVPSLDIIHEGMVEDVSMTNAPGDDPITGGELGVTDHGLLSSGRSNSGKSLGCDLSKDSALSPFLEKEPEPMVTRSDSWDSDDMGCSKSELEMLGWKFGNPISGSRVAPKEAPMNRPEQQIANPELVSKAVFNPAPVKTPYWYCNHYLQGTPTPLTTVDSAESLMFEPARAFVPKAPMLSTPQTQATAPAERTCIPGSPFLVKCLTPRLPPKVETPLPAVFELRYALDGTPRLLTGHQMEAARERENQSTRFQTFVGKFLPKKPAADQLPSARKVPLRLQNLNSLFGIKEEAKDVLLPRTVSAGLDSRPVKAKPTISGDPPTQKGTLSAAAKAKQSRGPIPALERCKREARETPVVRRMGTPATTPVSPSPAPSQSTARADKRKQDARQTPLEDKLAKKPREHSPLAGLGNVMPKRDSLVASSDIGKKTSSWFRPTKASLLRTAYGEEKRKQDARQTPLEQKPAKKVKEITLSPKAMPDVSTTPSKGSKLGIPRNTWETLSTAKTRLLPSSIHSPESQASVSPASVLSVGMRSPLGHVRDVQARDKMGGDGRKRRG
ncbi:hypothetical protein NCC49_002463 [Naganishia albida]|nr:hypothetical protein NCC49_002463 [Naganishia albida]